MPVAGSTRYNPPAPSAAYSRAGPAGSTHIFIEPSGTEAMSTDEGNVPANGVVLNTSSAVKDVDTVADSSIIS